MGPSRCKRIAGITFTLTLLVCLSYPLLPQSSDGSATKSPHVLETTFNKASTGAGIRPTTLRVSSDLVLVPITVTDGLNHPQTNLGRGNFTVFEGEQAQEIRYFSSEDSPVSVGLLLDVSRSMQDKIDTERAAVDQFFKNANPQDDYFVITFNNEPHVLSDVTQSTTGIENELGLVQPSGSTALLDAVYLGISKLRKAQYSRRALVIISDGGDNASRYKLKEIKNLISESDVMVYAIGIFASGPFKSFEEVMGKRWLSTMTDITGGRTATVQNVAKLPEECALLSRELRSQYVIGYRPRAVADGKWHKIKITVTSSSDATQFRPYYRKGYYASEP
jgi:Ca-activated chloride channel family protein